MVMVLERWYEQGRRARMGVERRSIPRCDQITAHVGGLIDHMRPTRL